MTFAATTTSRAAAIPGVQPRYRRRFRERVRDRTDFSCIRIAGLAAAAGAVDAARLRRDVRAVLRPAAAPDVRLLFREAVIVGPRTWRALGWKAACPVPSADIGSFFGLS